MRHPFESRVIRDPAPLNTIVVAGNPAEDARLILASGLAKVGFHTRLAGTGDELLREARADGVDLVIAEVGLACADGPCAIEALKRAPDIRHIAVVVYCASGRVISKARALLSGADRFIGDPTHLGGVFEAVTSMHETAFAEGRPALVGR